MANNEVSERYPLMTIFGRTLHFLTNEFEKRLKLQEIKITPGEFVVLYRLSTMNTDNITQQNFAHVMGKHKSVILRQIDELESRNFVTRLADETDKRKNLIQLTKRGIQMLNKVLDIEAEMMTEMTMGIDKTDLETLKRTAFTIQENALQLMGK